MKDKLIRILALFGIAFVIVMLFAVLGSCDKDHCYPIIQKDYVVYIHNQDTIKAFYENIDVSFQYCGDDVDEWAASRSFRVTTLYPCGGSVDGIHYEPLTISVTHMTLYIINP